MQQQQEVKFNLFKMITGLILGFGIVHVLRHVLIPYWWILFYGR